MIIELNLQITIIQMRFNFETITMNIIEIYYHAAVLSSLISFFSP